MNPWRGRCKMWPYSKNQKKESSSCDKCRVVLKSTSYDT
ncbi:unnamed protein product [Acanthoscelides obtectus]|uniref:Uncharacterized protein n=1 Tax=Acanthoscelides obtectus TaxID=200917 RepID=A0A9P0LZY5_ACAOB|nr:unnamed protein product [Acanthoscelides obtectus]CAK1656490.1 hypothetical protein AOBTE_LOCUS19744 [Acanthoscelides obtectus]